ncbi:hypothetical protein HZA87_00465 [Candidatus Uhrbacteria bacterium]|nr:hypothetical protein [Candidatus Uhrbacteria bacterium]
MLIRSWIVKLMPLILSMTFLFVSPMVTQAAESTCDCFCTSTNGAVDQQTKMTSATCASTCSAKGKQVAAFACTANQYPSRTLNCFSAEQCADASGTFDDFQPPECANGFHYCYPSGSNAVKATLQVSIGSLTTPADLGQYVGAVYSWLVGASTWIAIVMIMVGGLQWSFAAVSSEQIGKAKKRMMNGVVGLVLLLSTYLILATVNPNLVKLQVPQFPMIKTVSLVDNASCDELIKEGYTVEYDGAEECGTVGTVTKDENGADVADGTVCNFSKCGSDTEICVPGETPTCMECQDLTGSNPVVMVTQSVCSAFNSLPSYVKTTKNISNNYTVGSGANQKEVQLHQDVTNTFQQCFFTRDPDAGGEPTGRAACALVKLDCSQITSCSNYDDVLVYTGTGTTKLDNIDLGANSGLSGSSTSETIMSQLGDLTLGSFCQNTQLADMCGYNRGTSPKACYIDALQTALILSGTVADVVSSASSITYDCQDNSFWPSWLSF